MRIKTSLLAFIATAFLFTNCNRKTVNLEYTNCKGELPQLTNLVFRFDKPLVKDSLLNQWDSTDYISFEPKIPGRFRWEHPDELVFSPSRPLSPATTYKVSLNNQLIKSSAFGRIGKTDELSFHTPGLRLDNINFTWMLQDEQSRAIVPQLDMYFNYAVKPEELKESLKIIIDDKPVNFNLSTSSVDQKLTVQLAGLKPEDRDFNGKIVIAKSLKPQGGNNSMTDDIDFPVTLSSPYVLNINDVTTEHDGASGTVYIKTSQQLTGDDLSSYFTFDPNIKYTVSLTDDGCMISSEQFDVDKSYQFTIRKGIRGKIGGTLKDAYSNNVAFGELEPTIAFTQSKAVYLSSKGAENIAVKIAGVPKVRLIISKIYESNLMAATRYGYYPNVSYGAANEDGEYDYYNDYSSDDYTLGDVIYDKEIDTKTLQKAGPLRLLNFNITDRVPEFKGIYHVSIRSTKDYWVNDSRFVSLSDIGLIAKQGKEKFYVFANSIKTSIGISGVNVVLYASNNQVLGMGATNGDGVAEIPIVKKEYAGFKPAMVIVKTADDFNYLPLKNTAVNTSRFDVSGKRSNNAALDAFVYAERDMYRPGEKVNFSVVIRDKEWKSPGELPVKMKFLLPNGKELKSFRKNLNEQGSLDASIDMSASAITGSYVLEVYTSNDVLLATKNFNVEEFVPDRIKVTARTDKPVAAAGEKINLNVKAENFFGPPAADRNYECEMQVKQQYFSASNHNNYNFYLANQNTFFDKVERTGKTDGNGAATETFDIPAEYRNIGLLQADIYTTVFDETGRPVSRKTSVDIPTQSYFLGIGNDGWYYYPLNQKTNFQLIAVNKDGQQLNGAAATITVIKHEYRTVLAKSGSYFRYESQEENTILVQQNITVSGKNTAFPFTPRTPGNYEVRLSIPGANAYVSKTFYSYGNWGNDNSSFEVDNDGNIDIELDKASYYTGDNARILFKAPFSGRMLVTFETDKVLSYRYVNIDNRTAYIDLKIAAEQVPSMYITATLIKPHEVSDIPLTVAHGIKHVKVEEKGRKIEMNIVAKASVRSRTHQVVKVKAVPGSMVTLAAVDNGVLQLSDFKTPDPYNHFYARKALEVDAYDMYPLLFPEIRAKLSSTGGDGADNMNKRTNPIQAKRFKIVSYWSGIRHADGNGMAQFEFDIPQFSGEIRLMAVSYKDEQFGSAEMNMKVADPIVLSTALPRFLSPGDSITVPVTITNTTTTNTNANASIKVSGPLQVSGSSTQTVSLNANSEGRAYFKLYALNQLGAAKVNVQVNGLSETFTDDIEIAVRPASSLQKMYGSGTVAANTTQAINISTSDFMQGSVDYHLVISRSPAMEIASQLSFLVQYPYGCTEQTISTAFPQLYFADLADLVRTTQTKSLSANASYNIQEAIRKIKMRQLYTGAVTLWDGEDQECWWATIYAAHFLIEAQKAGYEVDKSLLTTILGYINGRLKNRETISYYYNRNLNKKIAPKETIYSLYVLALAGVPNISAMNYYKANQQLLSLDSRYLLSVAYALSGDKAKYKEMLPVSFTGEESVAQTGGSFYSDIRDEAIALNSIMDIDPSNPQVGIMARHVVNKLKSRTWYSTQECSFSFLALGKIARNNRMSNISAEIKVNGKVVGRMNNNDTRFTSKQLGGTNVTVETHGTGQLYYFWQSEGISTSGSYKEEDSYIRVRKSFYDRFGRQITATNFRQNELIVIGISLEKSYNTSVENIVITDLLPAGFEIENPRTKEIPGMDWIKNASTPTSLDVRDDRINLFVNLYSNRQTYYYAVRAVSPGTYKMGPVSADAMYNGEYHSYNGAGVIRVIQ